MKVEQSRGNQGISTCVKFNNNNKNHQSILKPVKVYFTRMSPNFKPKMSEYFSEELRINKICGSPRLKNHTRWQFVYDYFISRKFLKFNIDYLKMKL